MRQNIVILQPQLLIYVFTLKLSARDEGKLTPVPLPAVLWIRNYLFRIRIRPRKSFGSGSLPYLAQYRLFH